MAARLRANNALQVFPDTARYAFRKILQFFRAPPIVIVPPIHDFLFHFLAHPSIKTIFRQPIRRAPSTRKQQQSR